ncbi:transposase [Haloimpatiens sp. FM7315]|uniref:transposase n=1 Tax=Haloimpatiens sp. FM7315 TaxID=3298609 RepID=UPI0035A2F122
MAQKRYGKDYKVQAIKLAKEIGINKAAKEIGVAPSTVNGWVKAAKEGTLDLGIGIHTPDSALSITEELMTLKKQVKEQNKEIKRLKEENEFLEEASAFFANRRQKLVKTRE